MSSSFRRSRPKEFSVSSNTIAEGRNISPSEIKRNLTSATQNLENLALDSTKRKESVTATKVNAGKFRRRGTKAWTGGLTLTSSGHRELDAIFGGGQPLGTVVLLEIDRWTEDLGSILASYWAAEAVSQGQTLLLAATKPDPPKTFSTFNDIDKYTSKFGASPSELYQFVCALPKDLHLDKFRAKTAQIRQQEKKHQFQMKDSIKTSLDSSLILEELNEDEEEEEEQKQERADEVLNIAWQYSSKIQNQRSGLRHNTLYKNNSSNNHEVVYCRSYDLNASLVSQHLPDWESKLLHNINENVTKSSVTTDTCLQSKAIDIADFSCHCGFQLFKMLIQRIQYHLDKNDSTVVRILFLNTNATITSIALPLLMSYIQHNALPVVVFITIHPWIHQTPQLLASKSSLHSISDAVLHIQGFCFTQNTPAPEFRDLTGLLAISKMSLFTFTNYADHRRPPTNRYGLKRDRRKLQIQMLHLPPEEFSSGGGSVSGGGARSGGGKSNLGNISDQAGHAGCGTGSSVSSKLDF